MKAVILCAGYATRLYPITKNFPKPLLTVARKEIITHLVEKIEETGLIHEVFMVTNSKFYPFFQGWLQALAAKTSLTIHLVDDLTDCNEKRLGAIGDLNFVVNKQGISDDILVMAGDTLFSFSLKEFIEYYFMKRCTVVAAYDMKDKEKIKKRYGCIEIDQNNKILTFEEKPEQPKSSISATPFYIFPKHIVKSLGEYLFEKNNPDAPGSLIPWISKKEHCYAYMLQEDRYDIGTLESYNKVNELFENQEVNL